MHKYYKYIVANPTHETQLWETLEKRQYTSEILLLGQSGVGKSYLINALLESDKTAENAVSTGTMKAEQFEFPIKRSDKILATLKIWDTVGFGSDIDENECVTQLLKARNSGVIIVALKGSDERFRNTDFGKLIGILDQLYPNKTWKKHTVIVATRANEVKSGGWWSWGKNEAQQERVEYWSEQTVNELKKSGLTEAEARDIPLIWSRSKKEKEWKSELLNEIVLRASDDQKNGLAMINPYLINAETMETLSEATKDAIMRAKTIQCSCRRMMHFRKVDWLDFTGGIMCDICWGISPRGDGIFECRNHWFGVHYCTDCINRLQ